MIKFKTKIFLIAGALVVAGVNVALAGNDDEAMSTWLLDKGIQLYDEGSFEEAGRIFDATLALDRYNPSALSYKKRLARKSDKIFALSKEAMTTEADAEVHAGWNNNRVHPDQLISSDVYSSEDQLPVDIQAAQRHLSSIIIPNIDFRDANLEDVLLYLAACGRRHSHNGDDVDIAFLGMDQVIDTTPVSISFADASLYEALTYVAEMASLRIKITPYVIMVMPVNFVPPSEFINRSYNVSPSVGSDLESIAQSDSATADLFGDSFADEEISGVIDVSSFFSTISFPKGASAVYHPSFNKLFVRNTAGNISEIDEMLGDLEEAAANMRALQVEISTTFVEFNEGALSELGFDWTAYGDGTLGSPFLGNDDEFGLKDGTYFQKSSGYLTETVTKDGQTLYFDPITGGAEISDPDGRKGQSVFGGRNRTNVDAFNPVTTGILSTIGGVPPAMVFGNGDIDLRITALEQEGKADVLSAPKILTKSGSEAIIRVAETHRYPQDYVGETGQRTAPQVLPQDWWEADLGVSLKVVSVIDVENRTVDLELEPRTLAYKGEDVYKMGNDFFDNGNNNSVERFGTGEPLEARMAFFQLRSAVTQVTVADGHTVMMGGFIDERIETFRDQVPIIGDIPYLGRLFRSEGSRSVKKNLDIFVKASIVDPMGQTSADRENLKLTAQN